MTPPCPNRTLGAAIVCGLQKLGVGRFFMSPGARGSALVAAVAEGGADCTVHYDERGMAFAALGWSMATGKPAACLTTSGSAVANLLPACVEAFHSGVPLILVTADRPPELRGSGANQTIRQPGILGSFVRAEADLPCPSDVMEVPGILESLVSAALGPWPGPVHLNVPFDEPVLPEGGVGEFPMPRAVSQAEADVLKIPAGFFEVERGVVVLGRLSLREQAVAPKVLEFAKRLGWPLIADVLSGARLMGGVVAHADWILQNPEIPAPERVLHLGGSVVSKRLGKWLAACRGADYLQVRKFPERLDPWGGNPEFLSADIAPFLESVRVFGRAGWGDWWRGLDEKAALVLSDLPEGSEPAIACAVAEFAARNGDLLFLGNSMPVRDVDSCARAVFEMPTPVLGNRGASGIDGNIATIAGTCLGSGCPVVALLGDLAVLHDLNSLALLRDLPVTLVVINNNGGGIFRFLPIAIGTSDRERYWETPHGMDFQNAAAQFGLEYQRADGTTNLTSLLTRSRQKTCLVECRTGRGANWELHLEIGRRIRLCAG